MAVMRIEHMSKVLCYKCSCFVVIPEKYMTKLSEDSFDEESKLKVIWACHGGSGDDTEWVYNASLIDFVNKYNVAVVTVDAADSLFVNMAHGQMYDEYIANELPSKLQTMFSFISDKREDNFIVGLSNGGYGCLCIGLKHPDKYCAIGTFSTGDKAFAKVKPYSGDGMSPRIRVFGQDNITDTEYSFTYLATNLAKQQCEKPCIFHVCGSEDPWLDLNIKTKECFESLPEFEYEYIEVSGLGHEWALWQMGLEKFAQKYLQDSNG